MEAAENIHPDVVIDDRPEGSINVVVARITNQNLMSFDGLDITETVPGGVDG
jgi:hypothetical protein